MNQALLPAILLASASLRRRQILRGMNLRFDTVEPEVDETTIDTNPAQCALNNAVLKNEWARATHRDVVVLSADTVIDFAGRCIGKPRDFADADAMLRAFSGTTHHVLTALALAAPGSAPITSVTRSAVHFRELTDEIISGYMAAVNPLDKAGAYDIDRHGNMLVASFDGSYTNIMGLPAETLLEMLGNLYACKAGPR